MTDFSANVPQDTEAGRGAALKEGIAGVLLAGGRARRMGGGDKCLRVLKGKTLLERTIARAAPQTQMLLLNTNSDPARFAAYGLPVAADVIAGHAGPLAGILTAMEWLKDNSVAPLPWLASFPTDAPFFPLDLVARLRDAREKAGADLSLARSHGRLHPVFSLWPLALAAPLRQALTEGVRNMEDFISAHKVAVVDFGAPSPDPFLNINSEDELVRAAALAS